MQVIVSVGLAQNFAALNALVTSGIQRGHMKMQRRSLALSVGALANEIDAVVTQLDAVKDPDEAAARRILQQLRTQTKDDNDAKH